MRGDSAEEQAAGRPETRVRGVCVPLPRIVLGQVSCLFFGKSALVLPLTYTGVGHPTAATYPYKMFSCPALEEGMRAVRASLSVPYERSTIFRLPAATGMFAHLYGPKAPISCSKALLSVTSSFFNYETSLETLPDTSSIDVRPFVYSNADLLVLDKGNTAVAGVIAAGGGAGVDDIGKYHWATAADVAWDWDEKVWAKRLFHCLT